LGVEVHLGVLGIPAPLAQLPDRVGHRVAGERRGGHHDLDVQVLADLLAVAFGYPG
jgi:hypothetical protein